MQSVGSFFSSVTKFYSELNPATLSGAIDVVVVEQPNGELACSPFHVRFGKLSILRPQEKVVEVTINGHIVDFPMKVGDAGEAFFVFETEQEVPEEFATSPLAGPLESKVEEDIDFLDLAQVGDTGYVSAHSGHGSEFEEDEGEDEEEETSSPDDSIDLEDGQRRIATIRSRLSISVSLPCSPVLKAHDIMENFQPVDSAGPFGDSDDAQLDVREDQLPTSSSPGVISKGDFMRAHRDQVIMDMTGYKTDDSPDSDFDSDGPWKEASWASRRTRKKRGRSARLNFGTTAPTHVEQNQATTGDGVTDSRLPLRPTSRPKGRNVLGHSLKRSPSLPNMREKGHIKAIFLQKPASLTSSHNSQHHHHNHHGGNKSRPRRHSHKPTEQKNEQKPVPRPNLATNPLSDTELEYQTPRNAKDSEWSWGWGSLPVKNDDMDENEKRTDHVAVDLSSHPKPILNEMEVEGVTYRVAISLCPGDDFGKDLEASEVLFATNQISFDEFSKDPLKILNNKNLVCLINDRYFTWSTAGPYLASLMLFKKPLSDETLHQLSVKDGRDLSERSPVQQAPTRFSAISRWFRGHQPTNQADTSEQIQLPPSPTFDVASQAGYENEETYDKSTTLGNNLQRGSVDKDSMTRSTSLPIDTAKSSPIVSEDKQQAPQATDSKNTKRYAKTLRLTSEQLRSLNLKKGANTLTFSVTSSYQGKAVCSAKLFLWDHDVQVVISDIDGTITKSDALGHIFTMAGKDWTHTGVAKLYTDIVNNGYHILYLTSRAIGQADYTRKYLKNVEQNNYQLPDGPVIMSPDRLMTAFHREVILRKPEEFKMACLRDIKRLFGDRNPFYAGFGNRITDALSYRSVGVASSHIFSIDPSGEVKLELLSTFKSSYLALNDLVHEIFPGDRNAPEFNDWNYWKPTLPTIDLPMAPSKHPTLPQSPVDYNTYNSGASGGTRRLGVIRSLTSSFTSAGPLKKRPSIPAFNSSPSSTPTTSSLPGQTSPRSLTPLSTTASSPPPPPPASAPAGLQIADRTRRLSLSIMKYGSNAISLSPSISPTSSSPETETPVSVGDQRTRARGMSITLGGYIPSNLGTSPPTSYSSLISSAEPVHPLDVQTVKRESSFSVSPPQGVSRLTEAIPFLRRRSSKPDQVQDFSGEFEQGPELREEPADELYVEEGEYEGQLNDDGEEYEDEYGDENPDEDDDDDDVELNIDAPFL
ncbi:hypothetical protein BGX21_010361 [Mortierella sp. AD011]|nr:hypothetical protein BGX20_003321 [Mortierella sp. AD010]KAF9394485.1 hypothetical protein BGX21_010361 [Mortierella sp. AD011]